MRYKYKPKTKSGLIKAIKKEIYEVQGTPDNPNWNADLNCIDTGLITDMSGLFSDYQYRYKLDKFNGDISKWNVSNVEDMSEMFSGSLFNEDISNWDVSNVQNMSSMFRKSKFNRDISKWDVSNVENMELMFCCSNFNQNISNWNIKNVKFLTRMFYKSKFNQDISNWNVSNVINMLGMFKESEFNQDISNWKINKNCNIFNLFEDSKFNKDIGNWEESLKIESWLENISVSTRYSKLPDKIRYKETIENINEYLNNLFYLKEKLIYEIQVIDRLDNKQYLNKFINMFQNDLKEYLKELKEKYKNRQPDIAKKLMLKDILDIFKNINDKNFMRIVDTKFLKDEDIIKIKK